MKEKVWIFGDSYAQLFPDPATWPAIIHTTYNTENYAQSGSGPEYQEKILLEKIVSIPRTQLLDTNLIFLISGYSRYNFRFLKPGDQVLPKEILFGDDKKQQKKFASSHPQFYKFLHNFFREYVFYNKKEMYDVVKTCLFLKELSSHFKKVLVIPIFDDPYMNPMAVQLRFKINDTENFQLAKNGILFTSENHRHFSLNNHMTHEQHSVFADQIINWVEQKEDFNCKNVREAGLNSEDSYF